MSEVTLALIDDRLLVAELLEGLTRPRNVRFATTSYWYYRACRAAVVGAGGQLSGPFSQVDAGRQEQAILSLLELPEGIVLPDSRATVPVMARLAARHPRLNLLNLEATASAVTLGATVWLSSASAQGILPEVLDAEGLAWVVASAA